MNSIPIDAHTQLCAVIGKPVRHSMSPTIHNPAFASLGLNIAYLAFDVTDVRATIEAMRTLGILGLSVTIPHKVEVMRHLDELDPLVKRIGACNTVVNRNGRLFGYNTDVPGALQALRAAGFEPAGKRAILLGAGGASRALAFMLADNRAHLTIAARRVEAARELAEEVGRETRHVIQALDLNTNACKTALSEADLIINGTPVGMWPETDETPLLRQDLRAGQLVFDTIYNPPRTLLLKEAEAAGAGTLSGISMLVNQAGLQFELWTGKKAPLDVMDRAIREKLNAHE